MAIQLVTFGGLHALNDTGQLERLLAQRSRAAIFVYLAVERRVSRDALIAMFWPESDAENARHALRQSLYQLRKAVGGDWIESRAHELLVSDQVSTDALTLTQALDRGDAERVVSVYRGPFLHGVHLVDLKPWEGWVDSRRAQYARAFRKASRDLIAVKRAAGDLAGAIATAEDWTARDPLDSEAQHRLIEALAAAGERADAIRQYETYVRMLEPDGLEPLGETRALVERLRAEPAPLPARRAAAIRVEQASGGGEEISYQYDTKSTGHLSRRRSGLLSAALLLIVVVASVWGLRSALSTRAPTPSRSTIAVLPFSVRGAEDARYLGHGMVNLLGTALDGAGSMRRVDSRATFAAIAEAGDTLPSAALGDRVARRLGAGRFVMGDVVEAGGRLQIDAAVYDAGDTEPRSRATVSGAADSVFALVDRLAAQLLGGLGDPAADRLLRTAAVTTSSLPAFKAYLQGEAHMRAGRFERAADDYLAAIALDSTFAVAHYRLALAREWAPLPGNEEAASAAARHAARLSARDRMLLEAFRLWRSGDAIRADRAYRAIVTRYPEDVDAWFQLGEVQFHHGPLVGHPLEQSDEAWRKVLSYEPRNLFALTHLARMAAATNRAAVLDSVLAQFTPEQLREDRRLEELVVLRAVAKSDTAAARVLARGVSRGESFSVWRVAVFLTAFTPDPALMSAVIHDLTREYSNPGLRADIIWFVSLLDLAGGRLHAARAGLAEAARAEGSVPARQRRQAFGAVTEWYLATLPLPYADSTLTQMRDRASSTGARVVASERAFVNELGMGANIQPGPLRRYTLGILSLRLRDTAAAASAASELQRFAASGDATALTRDLDRGLRARLAWHAGRAEEALRLLESLELTDSQGDIAVTPFASRANERLLRAEILASLGRGDEALRWLASLGYGSVTELPLLPLARLRQAELHDRLGNQHLAARYHARFVELWRGADPGFRPLVDSVRRRLASVTRP